MAVNASVRKIVRRVATGGVLAALVAVGVLAAGTPAEAALQNCQPSEISISVGANVANGTHQGVALQFTNHSSRQCSLRGYPTLRGLDGKGDEIEEALHSLRGYLGGVTSGPMPTVLLAPGQVASALAERDIIGPYVDNVQYYAGVGVGLPSGSVMAQLGVLSGSGWGLMVHPIVPGDTGQLAG